MMNNNKTTIDQQMFEQLEQMLISEDYTDFQIAVDILKNHDFNDPDTSMYVHELAKYFIPGELIGKKYNNQIQNNLHQYHRLNQ